MIATDSKDSRRLEEERKKRRKAVNVTEERKRAKQAQARIDRYEEEAEEVSAYSLKGAKVSHDIKDFAEGEEIILTLKDSRLLDDKFQLNDEEDELENVHMAESDKWTLGQEATKKGYNVYEEIEKGDKTDVLKKYDELQGKTGFRLDGAVTSSLTKEERLAEVRRKLGGSLLTKKPPQSEAVSYSLEGTAQVASEYLPQTFKKKRRKKASSSRAIASSSREIGRAHV